MKQKKRNSRRGLHGTVSAIILIFILTASAAFPATWNKVADASFIPAMPNNGFNLGLDLQGGVHLVYEANMDAIPEADRVAALSGVRDVIERRVNAFGISEPIVQTNISGGNYRVIIELAGVFDKTAAIKLIGETPILEFKLPIKDINLEPTEEQQTEIDIAQETERKNALEVLDRALAGEDFGNLVSEYSVDKTTKEAGGYVGFIDETDPKYDGLAKEISAKRYKTGTIINGLYEATSSMHIVKYISTERVDNPHVSHILICHDESTGCESDRTKDEAKALIDEIAKEVTPKNFATLAKEKSEDQSTKDGGDLGVVKRGTMVAPFEEAVFALKNGKISDVVETDFGYHLIYRSSSERVNQYEIAQIEMPWTTISDLLVIDPWENTALSGKEVAGSSVAFDQQTGAPYVVLDFNSEGADLFAKLTEENVDQVIGIFLDGQPISTPVVQQAIYGGQASITGGFSIEEAKALSQRLNAGALPVPIELINQQSIGPTLGAISLHNSINAAIVGFAVVALFMILYYRLSGFVSVLALFVYLAVNLALYKWFGVTITLAGIAGFILSLGMAVDANVLIFERLKEELHAGRDLPTAIDEGFRRAWTSIRDGNITTLIAAGVLFSMSTSFIKGFALTLAMGVIVSMITAILVTRVFLKWISAYGIFKKKWLYNGPRSN
ncbi:protein translocase subunit SecD [Candidatus Uhrbacteria bacterium CG_4_10_14_0_2_um_filter_41_7]|uniref:Protein translocase subunit SecD n=1 Tax=Candidatus Uhrbacteria bacterium CG_4_9_14_3_um_filter_41_35 TaxID=1975034 RepID=A0A2M7XDQ6_9BACT|nr:MAG: protein translocase subunit SecD [Candidatus Uhrbacteria bacterium CG_4_10_14_0_2_um_filter_41_7]PJA46011.1 MAG: protein translocase subunit SecD [Candidatus Uhrbacteria bacterium CG_4_9_14_3_um_filter_41_35]